MNISEIGSTQINLLKKSQNFLAFQKKEGFNVANHPSCYLSSWSKEYGNLVLKSLNDKIDNTNKIFFNLKEIYKQYKFGSIEIHQKKIIKRTFNRIVVSGCLPEDFKKEGSYSDRYFSMKANDNKDTLWLVICHDPNMKIPEKFNENVIIIKNKSGNFIDFFVIILRRFFYFLFRTIIASKSKLNLGFIKEYRFEEKLKNFVIDLFSIYPIKELVLPYECQPFQNLLFKEIRKSYPKISTIGYIHSMITPFPSDFIKRDGSPNKVIVHGVDQKKIMEKRLGWKKKEILVGPSARYRKNNRNRFSNKVVLPLSFEKPELIIKGYENFLKFSGYGKLPYFKIKNHPAIKKSQKHQLLIQKINDLNKKYKSKFSKKSKLKNISIFISVSAAIIEALELKMNVFQIFSQSIYETHNTRIWKNIKVNKIAENVFQYRLINYNKYILFGKKNKTFDEWFKNFKTL